jgi:hypothetical protein
VFELFWQLAGAARLEAVTPAGMRYAVTGDIVRDFLGKFAAMIVSSKTLLLTPW